MASACVSRGCELVTAQGPNDITFHAWETPWLTQEACSTEFKCWTFPVLSLDEPHLSHINYNPAFSL